MKNKKLMILLIVLLLAIGFQAVSTNLFINGTTSIGTNKYDYEVGYGIRPIIIISKSLLK